MTGTLPWDQTLTSPQTDLSGPVAHALVVMSFVGSGVFYATSCGRSEGVSRLSLSNERGVSVCAWEGAPWDAVYVVPHCPGS